jgi:hypothetical protein
MNIPDKSTQTNKDQEQSQSIAEPSKTDAVEDDGTPVLDEADLEENNLTVEDAENIEWDEPKESGGNK